MDRSWAVPIVLAALVAATRVPPARADMGETPYERKVRANAMFISLSEPAKGIDIYTRNIAAYDHDPADLPLYLAQVFRREQAYGNLALRTRDPRARKKLYAKAAVDAAELVGRHALWEVYVCGANDDYFSRFRGSADIGTRSLPCGQEHFALAFDEMKAGRLDDASRHAAEGLEFVRSQAGEGRLTDELKGQWTQVGLKLKAQIDLEKGRH